jgi:hypothetical protein
MRAKPPLIPQKTHEITFSKAWKCVDKVALVVVVDEV